MVTSRCRTQPRTHISSLIAWPLLGQAPRSLTFLDRFDQVAKQTEYLTGHPVTFAAPFSSSRSGR